MGSRVRTGVAVVAITLLIWIVADQWVATDDEFSVTIVPTSANPDRYVAFADAPYHRTVTIKVHGRRSRIEAFRSKYEAPGGEVIRIPLDDFRSVSTEPQGLSTARDLLRQIPELRQVGAVVEADPETMKVRIDKYVDVPDIPLRFDYGELRVVGQSKTKKVTATLPEFVVSDGRFQADRRAVVHAGALITKRLPGEEFDITADVSLELPIELPPEAVRVSPKKIDLSGRIDTLEVTQEKGPITVKWSIPDSVQRDYAVIAESGEFVGLHLYVRGPKDRVSQLDATKIRAFVEILAADTASTDRGDIKTRDVVFLLPPEFSDCTVLEATEPRQVRFRLVKRGVVKGDLEDTAGVRP